MTLSAEKNIARISLLRVLFEGMSNLITTMGVKEKETGESDFFRKFTTEAMAIINDFAGSMTMEELGILMNLLIKLTNHTANLSKLFELTPDQKINVGRDLKELASETDNLANRIRARVSIK